MKKEPNESEFDKKYGEYGRSMVMLRVKGNHSTKENARAFFKSLLKKEREKAIDEKIELMELLGCKFSKESWYDEEGVDGTCIELPNKEEIRIYGHETDIDFNEVVEALKELQKEKEDL